MRDKIIKLFGLPTDASEDQVLGAVTDLHRNHLAAKAAADYEAKLGSLMSATNMNRHAAIETLKLHEEGARQNALAAQKFELDEQQALERAVIREQRKKAFAKANPDLLHAAARAKHNV